MKTKDSRRAMTAFAAVVAFAASCNLQASAQAAIMSRLFSCGDGHVA